MVIGVVGRSIDNLLQRIRNAIVPIMNRDSPDVDKDVEAQVSHLVQREKKRVDVIRDALKETIHWVESMAGKGRGNLPQMMGLV